MRNDFFESLAGRAPPLEFWLAEKGGSVFDRLARVLEF